MDWGANPSIGHHGEPPGHPDLDAVEQAISVLQGTEPAAFGPDALGDRVVRLESLLARLAAHEVDCLHVMESRRDAQALGFRSTQSWLRAVARLAPGAAKALAALARRIGERPMVRDALATGVIRLRHAQVLTQALEELGPRLGNLEDAKRLEHDLVEVAALTNPQRLADACRRWRIAAAPDQAVADDWVAFEQRRLSISRTVHGMTAGEMLLDPSSAEPVLAAIHAFSGPCGEDDTRTPGQRRADALTEICRRVLTFDDTVPTNGGERPQVAVIVPLATLAERTGAQPGELAWAGPISPEVVRRILCDAAVHRIIVDGQSQPLDVGRSTRVVPTGLRRAVAIRDQHCQWPGCDVPAAWCDCHHIAHWSRGGPTSLTNLLMLCGFHHHLLHLRGLAIVRRADGQVDLVPDPHDDNGQHNTRGP